MKDPKYFDQGLFFPLCRVETRGKKTKKRKKKSSCDFIHGVYTTRRKKEDAMTQTLDNLTWKCEKLHRRKI